MPPMLCNSCPITSTGVVYSWCLCKYRCWGDPGESCAPQGLLLPTHKNQAAVLALSREGRARQSSWQGSSRKLSSALWGLHPSQLSEGQDLS